MPERRNWSSRLYIRCSTSMITHHMQWATNTISEFHWEQQPFIYLGRPSNGTDFNAPFARGLRQEEVADHLGNDKYDPARRKGANSRNGTRTTTVLTDTVGDRDRGAARPQTAASNRRTSASVSAGWPASMGSLCRCTPGD